MKTTNDNIGKLPPQATEFEETVLGAIMNDSRSLNKVINLISADVFYKEQHKFIYEAILSLNEKCRPIDILTVTNELRTMGKLELAGGAAYITELTMNVASSANIEYHSAIIIQKFLARELIHAGTDIIQSAYEDDTDVYDLISQADVRISKINETSVKGGSFKHVSDITKISINNAKIREHNRKNGLPSGVSTGLKELNRLTGGWQKSDLIIIASRPGMGKTSLMLKFAVSAAKERVPVCLYSLEMSEERLTDNLLLSLCKVEKDKYKNGWMSEDDWKDLHYAQTVLNDLPIYIDPNPTVSMRYVKANSKVMQQNGKCGIIMLDYLQLADVSTDEKNRNREQEIAKASRQAKIIAKELNVPVILLCQLNRNAEARTDKKPQLSDLRESGAIEQDADIVMFPYRPEYYGIIEDSDGNSVRGVGKLIFAKHRDGGLEDIKFRYNPEMTQITNYDDYSSPENILLQIKPPF